MTFSGAGAGMAGKGSDPVDGGDIVRSWRQRMGWTQARAAEELGVHVHSLKNLEAGKRAVRSSLRRLLDTLESQCDQEAKRASARQAKRDSRPAPAPKDRPKSTDAELIEAGRCYAKTAAAHVTALLQGTLTAGLQAEMVAAERDVHRMQAMGDGPFSEGAMAVFGAFILISTASEKAALAALTARDGGGMFAAAADMRNGTLRDVAPTLMRGGQGTSVNTAPSVLIARGLRRIRVDGSAPSAEDGPSEPPADVSMDDLTQTDVDFIALTWRWTRMSAKLATDILDSRGYGRAETVETLGKAVLAAREELLDRPRGLAREAIEAARLANAVTYRLMMERRAVQETQAAAEPAAWVLDRRNQKARSDAVSTITAEGEGARQAVGTVQPAAGMTAPVTAEKSQEFLGLDDQEIGRNHEKAPQSKKRPGPGCKR